MSIKAVAWDIDGTLIDSEPLHLRALLATCKTYNADISDLRDNHFIGVNLDDVWQQIKERYPSHLSQQQWGTELNQFYSDNAHLLETMPEACDTIVALAKQGLTQVAVSNSNRGVVDTNLDTLGVRHHFKFSLSLDDVSCGKPSPIPYFKALDMMGLNADQVIAIEDSPSGIKSAREAGITVLGYGHTRLDIADADMKIARLSEVFQILNMREVDGL